MPADRRIWLAVLVAALGYLVDMFDLVMFSILRVPSLKALGVTDPEALARIGKHIFDLQLYGMLAGGFAFGAAGDRFGRTRTLFASIALYSIANVLNAFVGSVEQYGILRFVAGFGLAGELGAGVTLVGELLPTAKRGIGTTIVASVGFIGAVSAGAAAELLSWRGCYLAGGILGFALLILRLGVVESGLYEKMARSDAPRGNPFRLFWPPARLGRFVGVVLTASPIWFVGGVLFVFAPELGRAMAIPEPILAGRVIGIAYLGVVFGDVASGTFSQIIKSRRWALAVFILFLAAAIVAFLEIAPRSALAFYGMIFVVGVATGYWAVFVTTASELFGTNLRATAAVSAPNVVRALAAPITSIWFLLRPSFGPLAATRVLGLACCAVALVCSLALRETFHRDLDYEEA